MKFSIGLGRMVLTFRVSVLLLVTLSMTAPSSYAFKLNPCLRALTYTDGQLGEAGMRTRTLCRFAPEQYRLAVHEQMTSFAVDEYLEKQRWQNSQHTQRFEYMRAKPWSKDLNSPQHRTSALIFGTWWNDDPLMYTWGQGTDLINGLIHLKQAVKESRERYEGGTAGCRVPAKYHLTRWSHFGEMQHLHFMTSLEGKSSTPEVRVADTIMKAKKWIMFAYQVATQEITADAPLTAEMEKEIGLPPISKNHCFTNVKVWTLFTRIGLDYQYRAKITPDVALGSILHVVQDSFSPGHTCRVEVSTDGGVLAALKDVRNYNEQNAKEHAALDTHPEWLTTFAKSRKHSYINNPILIGAWLIKAVDQKLPWTEVETYLDSQLFATGKVATTSHGSKCI
ncbi:MAG: hypothetical protein IPP12_16615 [Nitrospira sp.]|nr:hypothetical protein [Nitrospira sp.]